MVMCGGASRSTMAGGGSLGVLSQWVFEREWEEEKGEKERK